MKTQSTRTKTNMFRPRKISGWFARPVPVINTNPCDIDRRRVNDRADTISRLSVGLLGLGALLILSANVRADEYRHEERHDEGREHREAVRERHVFRERDVRRFDAIELGHWRGGEWRNSCFAGRCGWWWFAGGQWYFYERPIYPYPLVVSEITFAEPVPAPVYVAPAPPVYVVPPPPPPPVRPAPAPLPPPPQMYYYCDNPPGYYPTVPSCPTGFRQVPATGQ
jgi:hypothetical protein